MEKETQHGGCLCGKVRYTITQPRIYGVVCHCKPCRRITGSSFVTADIYPRSVRLHAISQSFEYRLTKNLIGI